MCGVVATSPGIRQEVLGLVKKMEDDSVGRNSAAARQLLETIYREQEGRGGAAVDWVALIAELGVQVVNCRL